MPTSMVRSFADPEEFRSAARVTDMEMSITRRGTFAATTNSIQLHSLWMQSFFDSLPRVVSYNTMPGRAVVSFVPRSYAPILTDGRLQSDTAILRYTEGGRCFQVSSGPARIKTISLPVADIEALGVTYGEADFTPPRYTVMSYPAVAAMDRLQRLHASAAYLAEHSPEIIANPEAARGLEQALAGALADCLGSADVSVAARLPRARIMQRLQALLERSPNEVFHVPEICKLLGTSSRTLTTCCNEFLGMSPHRYLRLRQLNLANRALMRADPRTTTVTEIATNHGFWELGRFAGAYRALFGELPSATLQRDPDARQRLSAGMNSTGLSESA